MNIQFASGLLATWHPDVYGGPCIADYYLNINK